MKTKIIIMTTAIIRPTLHNKSIGNFYKNYLIESKYRNDIINNFDIYHIINIDSPEKLKQHFTLEDTINNFNKIIPNEVTKIYIPTEKPNFLFAFKNLMHKIKELNLLAEENFYWWLEDDWSLDKVDFNFFDMIKNILSFPNNIANFNLTLKYNAPLGSFMGGPIMNGYYFINHFNIENLGVMNNTCDPERQVSKYLTCNKGIIIGKNKQLIREIKNDYDKIINLIIVYTNYDINKIDDNFMKYYYEKNYNKNINFKYYIILMNNYNDIYYLEINYENLIDIKNINNYHKTTFNEFKNIIESKAITYFMVKPFVVGDQSLGKNFLKEYNLIKGWAKIGDDITYS